MSAAIKGTFIRRDGSPAQGDTILNQISPIIFKDLSGFGEVVTNPSGDADLRPHPADPLPPVRSDEPTTAERLQKIQDGIDELLRRSQLRP